MYKSFVSIAFAVSVLALARANAQDKNPFADFATPSKAPTSRESLYPVHPKGAVGLFRTYSALKQPASAKSFGIGFMGNYYLLTKDFPTTDLITERFDGGFYANYTPHDFVELFGGIGVVTTNNEAPANPLHRQIPNIDFGAKVSLPIGAKLHAGVLYQGERRSSISNITGSQSALNHVLMAVGTYTLTQTIPLRLHLNAGYRIDNNQRVAAVGANARVVNVTEAYPDNAIVSAFGVEYLLRSASLSLEYSLDMISGGSFSSNPQRVSVGTHIFPTADKALAIALGSDISTSNADATVAGVYKEPSYSFYFGLNYLFGLASEANKDSFSSGEVFAAPKSSNKPPVAVVKKGKIKGYVTNIETGAPVNGAKVQVCGGALLATDQSGQFLTGDLSEGPCSIVLTHPNFQPLQDQVDVAGGSERPYDFGLLQTPTLTSATAKVAVAEQASRLVVSAKDKLGTDVPALVYFANDRNRKPFEVAPLVENAFELTPGPYEFFAKHNGMVSQTEYVLLKSGEEKYIEFAFGISPKVVKISEDQKSIEISEKIQFEIGKSMLTYNSKKIVQEIAKVMNDHPEVLVIEIAGHTDSVGDATYNAKLSQARAVAVQKTLAEYGVDELRLRAVGYGEDFPISDNNTQEGKYQNRRVEFRILKRN